MILTIYSCSRLDEKAEDAHESQVKAGTNYPCSRTVNTGVILSPVFTAHVNGLWTLVVCTGASKNTLSCNAFPTRPVNTDSGRPTNQNFSAIICGTRGRLHTSIFVYFDPSKRVWWQRFWILLCRSKYHRNKKNFTAVRFLKVCICLEFCRHRQLCSLPKCITDQWPYKEGLWTKPPVGSRSKALVMGQSLKLIHSCNAIRCTVS